MADLDTLIAQREALETQLDNLKRRLALVEAEIFAARGEEDAAEWKRAEALGDMEASTRAWARHMARLFLARGEEPKPDAWNRGAILAAMEQIRAEGRS